MWWDLPVPNIEKLGRVRRVAVGNRELRTSTALDRSTGQLRGAPGTVKVTATDDVRILSVPAPQARMACWTPR
jgi:hypothetical protein